MEAKEARTSLTPSLHAWPVGIDSRPDFNWSGTLSLQSTSKIQVKEKELKNCSM